MKVIVWEPLTIYEPTKQLDQILQIGPPYNDPKLKEDSATNEVLKRFSHT